MSKYIIVLVLILVFHLFPVSAQINPLENSPEQIAFNYFRDSIVTHQNKNGKLYFNGKVSNKCSVMLKKYEDIKLNLDTCFNQIGTTKNINFTSSPYISKKRIFKKSSIIVDSACEISKDIYLVNIICGSDMQGVIYHIIIKNNEVYKIKVLNFII